MVARDRYSQSPTHFDKAVPQAENPDANDIGVFAHDLRRTGATIVVKALLNHNDKGVTGIYARWHMFEEKHEAVLAIEAAVLPLMRSVELEEA